MTKLIPAEKLEALREYWDERIGCMTVRADDLRAIIEQHKKLDGSSREESYAIVDIFLRNNLDDDSYSDYSSCLDDLYHMPTPQPNIIAELVKALEDDAHAATFQSMAGYRTAFIAKVKGMVG